jgi:hypothetical protein
MKPNIIEFIQRFEKGEKLTDDLLDLGYGFHDFSIKDEDYSTESEMDEEFRDLLTDTFPFHTMAVGDEIIKGIGEVSCLCIHVIDKAINDEKESVKFFIIKFQCQPILSAVHGTLWKDEFVPNFVKIISTEGPYNVEDTGYLDEMMGDLKGDDDFFED